MDVPDLSLLQSLVSALNGLVGLVVATVGVTVLSRDARLKRRIKTDREVLDGLPDGSAGRDALERLITGQVLNLTASRLTGQPVTNYVHAATLFGCGVVLVAAALTYPLENDWDAHAVAFYLGSSFCMASLLLIIHALLRYSAVETRQKRALEMVKINGRVRIRRQSGVLTVDSSGYGRMTRAAIGLPRGGIFTVGYSRSKAKLRAPRTSRAKKALADYQGRRDEQTPKDSRNAPVNKLADGS